MQIVKNNKLILKSQQRFRRDKYNVFTEEVNKIALSTKSQSIDSIETYAYGTRRDLPCQQHDSNNMIKQ